MSAGSPAAATGDLFEGLVGQAEAVELMRHAVDSPVHAYLLVGPSGAGSRDAAFAFAGELLAASANTHEDAERHRRLAAQRIDPCIFVVEREGASISREQVRAAVRRAETTPPEGSLQVLIFMDFHLVSDAAPVLLKTLEEPPPTTVFIVVADDVPQDLVTIASRCVRIELPALPAPVIAKQLTDSGVPEDRVQAIAAIADGDLARAYRLASDPEVAERWERWANVPHRLDGTGSTASLILDELLADLDAASELYDSDSESDGESIGDRKAREARRNREKRRARAEMLRAGLQAMGSTYRELATDGPGTERFIAFSDLSSRFADREQFNVRDDLALLDLLLQLPPSET